jgi:2-dehydro-3-deoxyphosphogluconate aldolase/(4S)-4-hydroxy-2-oxoglutarate aldolase
MHPAAFLELRDKRLIAVIRAPSPKVALEAAEAVARGGITMLAITFTVPVALQVIAALAKKPHVTVGAGTVLTAAQARDALAAGAKFIIAPNISAEVAQVALEGGVLYAPGAYTTNEILAAHAAGAHVVKVDPVGIVGGPQYIQVIRDPIPNIPFLAAGGTTLENVSFFLKAGCMGVGLGASLADPRLAAAGQVDEITRRARAFLHRLTAIDAATAPLKQA